MASEFMDYSSEDFIHSEIFIYYDIRCISWYQMFERNSKKNWAQTYVSMTCKKLNL